MGVLVDTNILLRRTQPNHEHHTAAVASVIRLFKDGEPAYFTPQNIAEFWNVMTRPVIYNGLGFPVSVAMAEVKKVEQSMTLLADSPSIYAEWKNLVVKHSVLGSQVHDARLAAAMKIHGINRILTFNTADFSRYGVEVLHPAAMAS